MLRAFLAALGGLLSAVLVCVSLESAAAAPVAWVALIPVLVPFLFLKRSYGPASAAGLTFGLAYGAGAFRWCLTDGRPVEWATNALSLGCVGLGWAFLVWRFGMLPEPAAKPAPRKGLQPLLPTGGVAAAAWARSVAHLRIATLAAASLTVLEWARGVVVPAWNPLGLALASNLPLLQTVKATGPAGLTTMLVFTNTVALLAAHRLWREPGRMSWAARFDITGTLAILFLGALAGFYTLTHPTGAPRRKVLCAQRQDGSVNGLVALSVAAGAPGFDLVVWREAAFGAADYRALNGITARRNVALFSGVAGGAGRGLVGSRTVAPGAVSNLFIANNNEAFFAPFSPPSNRNLAPFTHGDVRWLPLLNWQAGSPQIVRATLPTDAQAWIALFDVPGHSRRLGRQLRDNLRVWAIAYGKALVFSGRGAGSLLQGPSGRVVSQAGDGRESVAAADLEVAPSGTQTLYARFGDWWPVAMGAVTLAFALRERLQRRRAYGRPRRLRP